MNRLLLLALLHVMSHSASAELNRLLEFQRLGDSGAYISSGFHDWRTVSKYRRQPGLHAGYDIAMLANSPVRAAWSGTVIRIAPWYGSEYGVTVRDPSGYEATYGHISPSVRAGQSVRAGDILGRVVVDHVDVKICNQKGAFVDFATLAWTEPDRDIKVSQARSLPSQASAERARAQERYRALAPLYQKKKQGLHYGFVAPIEVAELEKELSLLKSVMGADSGVSGTDDSGKSGALGPRMDPSKPRQPSRVRTDELVRGTRSMPGLR